MIAECNACEGTGRDLEPIVTRGGASKDVDHGPCMKCEGTGAIETPDDDLCSCVVVVCSCGRRYDRSGWDSLTSLGVKGGLDWRNCACGSTITLDVGES